MTAPYFVVVTADQARAALDRLTRAGWRACSGFAPDAPAEPGRPVVRHGPVTDPVTAAQAVRAARAGAGIVALADPVSPLGRRLVLELGRLPAGQVLLDAWASLPRPRRGDRSAGSDGAGGFGLAPAAVARGGTAVLAGRPRPPVTRSSSEPGARPLVADQTPVPGQQAMRQQAMPGPQPMPEQTNAPAVAEHPAGLAVLHADQRALLERLAAGQTIAAAAAAEYLSLRTANRRIAAARLALGVATTRDAVSAYLRHRHTRG